MIRKNPTVDLKLKYRKVFEISLVMSLFMVIVAFRFIPEIKGKPIMAEVPKIWIDVTYIPPTGSREIPPPPPKINIIEENLFDDEIEDILIEETDLDDGDYVPKTKFVDTDDEVDFNSVYFVPVVEVMPEPIGGIKVIQEKIIYPELARRAQIQGTVFVKAFIDKNGNVQKVELLKGIGLGCDKEAINAVFGTKFIPGKQRGRPVNVQVSIPIKFILN